MGQPVDGQEPMEYVYVGDDPPWGRFGALPPVEDRTTEREEELKGLHWIDVRALGTPPLGGQLESQASDAAATKWAPVGSEAFDQNQMSVFSASSEAEDIEALARYAATLDANALELGEQEKKEKEEQKKQEESPWTLKGDGKAGRKYEGDLRSGKSTTENKASLDANVEYKLLDKKWAVHEQEDKEGFYQNHLRVFGAQTKVAGSAGRITEDGKTIYGAKGEASASAAMLEWKNKFTRGTTLPREVNVDVTVAKVEGKASGEATINMKEGEATLKGHLGAEAVLYEITVDKKVSFVPARWLDAACDHTWLGSWNWSQDLCRAVETDEYDYGITLGGSAGVTTGAAAKAEGGFEKKNGKWKLGGKAKAAIGAGGTLGGSIEGGKIGR
jgi:hypothetical protein